MVQGENFVFLAATEDFAQNMRASLGKSGIGNMAELLPDAAGVPPVNGGLRAQDRIVDIVENLSVFVRERQTGAGVISVFDKVSDLFAEIVIEPHFPGGGASEVGASRFVVGTRRVIFDVMVPKRHFHGQRIVNQMFDLVELSKGQRDMEEQAVVSPVVLAVTRGNVVPHHGLIILGVDGIPKLAPMLADVMPVNKLGQDCRMHVIGDKLFPAFKSDKAQYHTGAYLEFIGIGDEVIGVDIGSDNLVYASGHLFFGKIFVVAKAAENMGGADLLGVADQVFVFHDPDLGVGDVGNDRFDHSNEFPVRKNRSLSGIVRDHYYQLFGRAGGFTPHIFMSFGGQAESAAADYGFNRPRVVYFSSTPLGNNWQNHNIRI